LLVPLESLVMTDSLSTSSVDTLVTGGVEQYRSRGYDVSLPDDSGEPPAVAEPTPEVASRAAETESTTPRAESVTTESVTSETESTTPRAESVIDRQRAVGLEPLVEADPTTVLSRLWTNQEHDRITVFLTPGPRVAAEVEQLLSAPVGVQAADDDGRVFFSGPDRVPLAEGGYAAVPSGTELCWRETNDPLPASMRVDDDDGHGPTDDDGGRGSTNRDGRLELRADGEPLAVLSGVDTLDCPPRERFPYAYERDTDKRIRVVDFAGRPVDAFPGVAAMRAGGFQPVPAPLVPEHMLDGDVSEWWNVTVVE
jgi:hypothetical protein